MIGKAYVYKMGNDFNILEFIQKETDIEALRAKTIEIINNHEAELVMLHEEHQNEIYLLQQQLFDSNASTNALKKQIQKMKDMQEVENDKARINELQLTDILNKTRRENSLLREKLTSSSFISAQSFDMENLSKSQLTASIQANSQTVSAPTPTINSDKYTALKHNLDLLKKENQQLKESFLQLTKKTKSLFKSVKSISTRSIQSTSHAYGKLEIMMKGLINIKKQIREIKAHPIEIQMPDFKGMQKIIEKRILRVLVKNQKISSQSYNDQRSAQMEALLSKAEEAKALITKAKALSLGASAAIRLFIQTYRGSTKKLHRACTLCTSTVGKQIATIKQREHKKVVLLKQELVQMQNEINVLKHEREVQRQRRLEQKQKQKQASSVSSKRRSRSVSQKSSSASTTNRYQTETTQLSSECRTANPSETGQPMISFPPISTTTMMTATQSTINPSSVVNTNSTRQKSTTISNELRGRKETRVSVGVLAHLSTPFLEQMRERTKRISKESELTALEAEQRRKEERISQLEGQLAGLRRIIRRNGETSEEELGKARQAKADLEKSLRDEQRALQKKSVLVTKLQKDTAELKKVADTADAMRNALLSAFRTASDRLAPLLAEQTMSNDLNELDELAKEFFNVPIHKICAPAYQRNYLKKMEHKFETALKSANMSEINEVFASLIDELKNRACESNQK